METEEQKALRTPGKGESSSSDEPIQDVPLFRRKGIWVTLLIILLACGGVFWYWYASLRGRVSTDDAYIDAHRAAISSKVLGRIATLAVDEGDHVTKGEPLVRLDDSTGRASRAQAQASLVLAEASASLAKVNLNRAQDDFHRAEMQYRHSVIPKEQYDHAVQTLAAARAERTIAEARVRSAAAQLSVVESDLANMVILSPIDGTVAKRWMLPGDIVQPGQPIYSIYDTTDIWVTANLEETKLAGVHEGDRVTIDVDAYPDIVLQGTIRQIHGYAASQFALIPPNNASGNFTKVAQRVPLKIGFDPAEDVHRLLPGMSVEVTITVR
jgi:membrane fusion protein (multidrug efflux system)